MRRLFNAYGFGYGVRMEVKRHPEVGEVLMDNSGAAGDDGDNAYSRGQGPASSEILAILQHDGVAPYWGNQHTHRRGTPGQIAAVLASDGWWWKVV